MKKVKHARLSAIGFAARRPRRLIAYDDDVTISWRYRISSMNREQMERKGIIGAQKSAKLVVVVCERKSLHHDLFSCLQKTQNKLFIAKLKENKFAVKVCNCQVGKNQLFLQLSLLVLCVGSHFCPCDSWLVVLRTFVQRSNNLFALIHTQTPPDLLTLLYLWMNETSLRAHTQD